MNISGVSQNSDLTSVNKACSTQSSSNSSIPPASADATQGASSTVSLSKPAERMQKLAELQKSDPSKFKDLMNQISDQLSTAAKAQTGAAADKLNELASRFQSAGQSGDLSSLQPQGAQGHHGHHGHQHGNAAKSSDASGAREAYAKNGPPNDAVKNALDSAFALVDQATSGAQETTG